MTQALTTYTTFDETMSLGDLLAKSGFFPDSRTAAQAVVKVLAGREIGFGPIASMTGINVIQGRVSLSANLIAAAIKRSGKYDYRVKDMTVDRCEIDFRELVSGKWEVIGNSVFTRTDANAAGTKNMDKFARNMLFARALSNGARWYCPDIFGGPVYTPEELGATVDGETGEVIDAPRVITVEKPSAGPAWTQDAANDAAFEAMPSASLPADRYEGGKVERGANGKATANGALPFVMNEKGAIEWAMSSAPQVWPVDGDGIIVRDAVKNSFRKLATTENLHGEALGYAWVAKVAGKLDDYQRSADLDAQAAAQS